MSAVLGPAAVVDGGFLTAADGEGELDDARGDARGARVNRVLALEADACLSEDLSKLFVWL